MIGLIFAANADLIGPTGHVLGARGVRRKRSRAAGGVRSETDAAAGARKAEPSDPRTATLGGAGALAVSVTAAATVAGRTRHQGHARRDGTHDRKRDRTAHASI